MAPPIRRSRLGVAVVAPRARRPASTCRRRPSTNWPRISKTSTSRRASAAPTTRRPRRRRRGARAVGPAAASRTSRAPIRARPIARRRRHRRGVPIQESRHGLRPSHGAAPVPPAPGLRADHRPRARPRHRRRDRGLHHRRLGRAAAAALPRARPPGEALGHQHREGAHARPDLAGHVHGLPGAAGVRGRRRVVAARREPASIPASIRCASRPSRRAPTCSRCSASARSSARASRRTGRSSRADARSP